jgi:hypothetical protein
MKHYKTLKLTILVAIFCLHSYLAAEVVTKKLEEATEAKCEDPCQGK